MQLSGAEWILKTDLESCVGAAENVLSSLLPRREPGRVLLLTASLRLEMIIFIAQRSRISM